MNISPILRFIAALLLLLIPGLTYAGTDATFSCPGAATADSPANATYFLENDLLQLENGWVEQKTIPGSASKVLVKILGNTATDDLDNDGDDDAVVFLSYDGGGSGTFFYLAAALSQNGKYYGTNGILLGDRIGQPAATVQNRLVSVSFLDRAPGDPMAAKPTFPQTRYFILDNCRLREIQLAAGESVYQGWLRMDHEVPSFRPCGAGEELWLNSEAPAFGEVSRAYAEAAADLPPYQPVFAIVVGHTAAAPPDVFAAHYREAMSVSELVRLWSQEYCRSGRIVLSSPLPGAAVAAPLAVKGRARGTWFFEGDFPLILLDELGRQIATGYATAQGEWMTGAFVDFAGTLTFSGASSGQRGLLVLKKDNPTGLPKFDDALEIPIHFK